MAKKPPKRKPAPSKPVADLGLLIDVVSVCCAHYTSYESGWVLRFEGQGPVWIQANPFIGLKSLSPIPQKFQKLAPDMLASLAARLGRCYVLSPNHWDRLVKASKNESFIIGAPLHHGGATTVLSRKGDWPFPCERQIACDLPIGAYLLWTTEPYEAGILALMEHKQWGMLLNQAPQCVLRGSLDKYRTYLKGISKYSEGVSPFERLAESTPVRSRSAK